LSGLKAKTDIPALRDRIRKILPEIVQIRRDLHRIPETKLEERETSARIRELAAGTGIELLPPYIGTDVVGLLRGKGCKDGGAGGARSGGNSRETNVTLRADMDALPIEEKSGKKWCSAKPGRSHACGHDGHMAVLLGTLKVLDELAESFCGSVRFVFQPAEEEAGGGAMMVEKGLLDTEPRPSAVFALHGWPGTPVGSIAAASGPAMAAQDRFRIAVKGRGGHGAVPHKTVDSIVTAAQIVTGLQTVVSRTINPVAAAVLSICTIHGGQASNVIPDEVVMEGTTRYFDRKIQTLIRSRMEEVIRGICASAGAHCSLDYREGYISLVNDPDKVRFVAEVTKAYLGPKAWIPDLAPSMGAEDFAFYLDKVPGVFLRLGLGEDSASLHSPEFDFNDKAIEAGITVMCALALETLAGGAASQLKPTVGKGG